MKSTPVLRVALQPSRRATIFIVAATIVTALLLAFLPGEPGLRGAAVVIAAAYGIHALRFASATGKGGSIAALELGADRRAIMIDGHGGRLEGVIQPESYVGAFVTTVVLRPNGARRSRALAIWPDTMSADEFRRLRVLLRHGEASADQT